MPPCHDQPEELRSSARLAERHIGKGASPMTPIATSESVGYTDPTIPELLYPNDNGPHRPRSLEGLRDASLRRAREEAASETKRWLDLAGCAHCLSAHLSKSKISNAQALGELVHGMPKGPHSTLLRLALLSSTDLVATTEGVGQAAEAIADALKQITPVVWDH